MRQNNEAKKIIKPLSFTWSFFYAPIFSPQQQTNPKGSMSITVYATNNPEVGYEFQGSFISFEEAQAWATAHGLVYTYWWADEDYDVRPSWTRFPDL